MISIQVAVAAKVKVSIHEGTTYTIKKFNAGNNRDEIVDVKVVKVERRIGQKTLIHYTFKGGKRPKKLDIGAFKNKIVQ